MAFFKESEAAAAAAQAALGPDPTKDPAAKLEEIYHYFLKRRGSVDQNTLTTELAAKILERSVNEGASDVHFEPQGDLIGVRFRIDGDLHDRLTFSKKDFPVTAVLRVMSGFSPQAATAYSPEDGAFAIQLSGRAVRFRASSFPTIFGDKLVVRLLDMGANTLSLDALGFLGPDLADLKSAIASPSGIFFVCGITGGGKTTTLCSILKHLQRPEINIMTLEDPVEYQLPRVTQSSVNPKAGFSFADGLRSILRQDPNIIMVGEIRDLETAEIAMRAALTGHLIFSTIHSISTAGVIGRLIDMGIQPFLIADAMIGALAQRLVRKVCAGCSAAAPPTQQEFDSLTRGLPPEDVERLRALAANPQARFARGSGCAACKNSGYKGRVGLFELLLLSKPLRDMVANKAPAGEVRAAAVANGMKTLLMDGVVKSAMGLTTLEEVRRVTAEL